MNAADLVRHVHDAGANLRLGGPTGIELVRYRRIDAETIDAIRAHRDSVRAFLAEQDAATATDAVLAAQRLLREGRWPQIERDRCGFDIGYSGEDCKRCGASVAEHYGKQ